MYPEVCRLSCLRRSEQSFLTDECDKNLQAILVTSEDAEPEMVDLEHAKELGQNRRKQLLDRAMESQDMDNERFLEKLTARMDRSDVDQNSSYKPCFKACWGRNGQVYLDLAAA